MSGEMLRHLMVPVTTNTLWAPQPNLDLRFKQSADSLLSVHIILIGSVVSLSLYIEIIAIKVLWAFLHFVDWNFVIK